MGSDPIAIVGAGAVCSVGLDAFSAFAAIRAGTAGFAELDVADRGGEWIRGGRVPVDADVSGTARRLHLLAMAVQQCLQGAEVPLGRVAVILCAADNATPADVAAFVAVGDAEVARHVPRRSASHDASVSGGKAGIVPAVSCARQLLVHGRCDQVLVMAVDSLLSKRLLAALEREGRLLTSRNSDGFLPGEAAAAILLSRSAPAGGNEAIVCCGLGMSVDVSTVRNDVPLRADGLSQAIKGALEEADCALDDVDLRIADISGEQYFFKEAALSLTRLLRRRREQFALWAPADCIGEVGAAIGPFLLALAKSSVSGGYSPGPAILCHFSDDQGLRGAIVLRGNLREGSS
jgi:3-oxoacyl-[acyl-carrier-protein] synthase I